LRLPLSAVASRLLGGGARSVPVERYLRRRRAPMACCESCAITCLCTGWRQSWGGFARAKPTAGVAAASATMAGSAKLKRPLDAERCRQSGPRVVRSAQASSLSRVAGARSERDVRPRCGAPRSEIVARSSERLHSQACPSAGPTGGA
jgi:hypothetical protein